MASIIKDPGGRKRIQYIDPNGRRRTVRLGKVEVRYAEAIRVRIDCWQTLRRSCEIEWAQVFPQYAVSKWIGHSISVSGRHYANSIPDELFVRAAKHQAAQIAAQHEAE